MKPEAKWIKDTAKEIEAKAKDQSPFMTFVDCNDAWKKRYAEEAEEALENIIKVLDSIAFHFFVTDEYLASLNKDINTLEKFIKRNK